LHARALVEPVRISVRTVEPAELPTERAKVLKLTEHQQRAIDQIEECIRSRQFRPVLIFGVTGSGKTEVYLQAIERVVRAGREAIVLVPEISLTPQTIRRFRSRFEHIAVLHSHLTDAERHYEWDRIAAGQVQVFAPTRRLGLIVLDEEHETTFKQEATPRYHAREVAWRRAELAGVPLLLGSATPSLETWQRSQRGDCIRLALPERVQGQRLPAVELIDLRVHAGTGAARRGAISRPLEEAMREALAAGGQVILLLNRRGFSTHIHCIRCGHVERCPRCDIALVLHRDKTAAVCHFCDLQRSPPERCPSCRDAALNYSGIGTERLEREVRIKFPEYTLLRMDTDTMRRPGSHEAALSAFRDGRVRILLGTQMIAKGLDFPGVTLVGVVNADTALHLPDFRAAERTFQLVAQVAGRTGRGERPGRVLVQTLSPGTAAIQAAARHDYAAFAQAELEHRRQFGYPPFGSLARIIVRSRVAERAKAYIEELAAAVAKRVESVPIRLLGPAPAPVSRIRGFHRFHLLIQGPVQTSFTPLLRPVFREHRAPGRVEVAVDVDPVSVL
jgi:primosomal protein N' (replication factor Y)